MKAVKWIVALAVAVAVGFGGGVMAAGKKDMALTGADEVQFQPLDPNDKEGKGPAAAVVFGDMKGKGPVGILLRVPADGRATPHTHTSDYYGVMIKGTEHNYAPGPDEGKALGPGSYWFQPGKQPHDNHCEAGAECLAFIYFPKGFDMKMVPAPAAK